MIKDLNVELITDEGFKTIEDEIFEMITDDVVDEVVEEVEEIETPRPRRRLKCRKPNHIKRFLNRVKTVVTYHYNKAISRVYLDRFIKREEYVDYDDIFVTSNGNWSIVYNYEDWNDGTQILYCYCPRFNGYFTVVEY